MKDTTKKSLADEFCKAYTEFHGELIDNPKQITSHTFTGEELMEFCQFYASQFVKKDEQPDGYLLNGVFKTVDQFRGMTISAGDNVQSVYFNPVNKDSVSSDVEQAANEYATGKTKYLFKETHIESFKAGAKWQSTQQPATINFFSDEEIEEIGSEKYPNPAALMFKECWEQGAKHVQSKLKDRVNCVDEDKTKCSNEGCQLPASCGGKCGAHCDCLA